MCGVTAHPRTRPTGTPWDPAPPTFCLDPTEPGAAPGPRQPGRVWGERALQPAPHAVNYLGTPQASSDPAPLHPPCTTASPPPASLKPPGKGAGSLKRVRNGVREEGGFCKGGGTMGFGVPRRAGETRRGAGGGGPFPIPGGARGFGEGGAQRRGPPQAGWGEMHPLQQPSKLPERAPG